MGGNLDLWKDEYIFGFMKEAQQLQSARLDKAVMKDIRKYVAENGGSIRKVLECGALWVMSKGAKEYLNSLKK